MPDIDAAGLRRPPAVPAGTDADRLPARLAAMQVFLCALWGLSQIATKVGNAGISPLANAGLRSAGAAILVYAWIRWRRLPLDLRDGTLGWGVAIGTLFGLEFVCLYIGVNYTTAARATLLQYTAPFFVALGVHRWVPGDRLTPRKLAGLAAAFAGVLIVFQDRSTMPAGDAWIGDALCLAAAVFWAGTTILVKATPLRTAAPEKTLLYQLVVSAVMILGASLAFGEPGVFAPSTAVWLALAYQTVIVATASYLAWFWLVSRYRASVLSTFTFLTPVFGVGLAWLLLGEPVGIVLVASLALIAAGIVLVNRG